ncbi:MAG: hypothetical protein WDN06_01665 [Asticcacaulis sp.]
MASQLYQTQLQRRQQGRRLRPDPGAVRRQARSGGQGRGRTDLDRRHGNLLHQDAHGHVRRHHPGFFRSWRTSFTALSRPGLYRRERAAFLPFLIAAPILFLLRHGAGLLPDPAGWLLWFSLTQQIVGTTGVDVHLMPRILRISGIDYQADARLRPVLPVADHRHPCWAWPGS